MVEDEPDGDVQNAGGGVVDEPEGFEVEGVDSVATGSRWWLPVASAPPSRSD